MAEMQETMVDLEARCREFFVASLLLSYPDAEVEGSLLSAALDLEGHPGAGPLLASLAREGGDELRSRHIDLFDRGKGRVSLYETEYGRMSGMGKGNELADIAGFYRAFGFSPGDQGEAVDHAAVELEFYALLLIKSLLLTEQHEGEGVEVVADARKKFMADHLGRFLGAAASRPGPGDDPSYGPALSWCARLVEGECARLGVSPAPLDFFADPSADGEVRCGGLQLPVLQGNAAGH